MQVLAPQSFMLILSAVRAVFSACLQHACRVQAAVLAAAASAASSAASKPPALPRAQEKELQKLLGSLTQSISDAALGRWTKLLAARCTALLMCTIRGTAAFICSVCTRCKLRKCSDAIWRRQQSKLSVRLRAHTEKVSIIV